MGWVEELRAHEAAFRRAPSAHNTQPWTLSYGAGEIRIAVDPGRALPRSDPGGRDLALGLGAFAETAMIIAAGLGLPVAVEPSPAGAPSAGPGAVGLRLVAAAGVYPTPFTAADVDRRRVARGRYRPGPIDPAVLAALEPGLVALPARTLAADLKVADRWMFGTPEVTAELREWLRLTPRHPRYAEDGLTDRALALTRPEAVALRAALAAYPVARRFGLARLLAASGGNPLGHDGSVLVLTGSDPLAGGRRLMRTWLTLARHGLSVHPLSQLLDCPATAARIAGRVGAPPLAVFRAGRPVSDPVRSARLPVA